MSASPQIKKTADLAKKSAAETENLEKQLPQAEPESENSYSPKATALCMSNEINVITIGHPSAFRQLHTEGNYAVFVKTRRPFLPDLYVGGKLLKTARDFQPASAIAFFDSEASAIEALKRWAMGPVPPKPLPKVRDSRDHRRTSNRKHKAEIDACQLELDL